MIDDIIALLELFEGHVPDRETNTWVNRLARDPNKWSRAHDVFGQVRRRNLVAINLKDLIRECQYCFEEVCLKSLYNETDTVARFDSDSPYWVIKNAIVLARAVGVSLDDVVKIVAPDT
jgi:hypothetical protein